MGMSMDNRHPAGTSVGGQWAPGSSSEVETDDDFDPEPDPARGLSQNVDELLGGARTPEETASAADARAILRGESPPRRDSADLFEAKEILHAARSRFAPGQARDDAEDALTRLYRSDHPDPQKGVGRLVGSNDECRKAESFLRSNERFVSSLKASQSALREIADDHPGMADIEISTEQSYVEPTGVYRDSRGDAHEMDESDRENAHRKLVEAGFDRRFTYGEGLEYAGANLARVNIASLAARRGAEAREVTLDETPTTRDGSHVKSAFAVMGDDVLTVERGLSGIPMLGKVRKEELQ